MAGRSAWVPRFQMTPVGPPKDQTKGVSIVLLDPRQFFTHRCGTIPHRFNSIPQLVQTDIELLGPAPRLSWILQINFAAIVAIRRAVVWHL